MALVGTLWVLQLNKMCHIIMSGNDCWNRVCFSCCRKADNNMADVILSGSLIPDCAPETGN